MRSASSRPLWLLLSAAVAFGVLAWSAQREPSPPRPYAGRIVVVVEPGSSALTYRYSRAGSGFFRRLHPITAISGVDTVTRDGGITTCLVFTRVHGRLSAAAAPCVSGTAQWQLRQLP